MGRFVTGPCGADARQFHVKSAASGCVPEGRCRPGKRNRSELHSARGRAHLRKRSGCNGKFDYPLGRRKRTSERRGARTREIAGSLTMIRLRDDPTSVSSRAQENRITTHSESSVLFSSYNCKHFVRL